jgi:hypothetical protein
MQTTMAHLHAHCARQAHFQQLLDPTNLQHAQIVLQAHILIPHIMQQVVHMSASCVQLARTAMYWLP